MESIFSIAEFCINECDPTKKVALTQHAYAQWQQNRLSLAWEELPRPIGEPGRPEKPVLVAPRKLPRRTLTAPSGLAALVHAIAHIEFNAINLALDAVYRYRDMPNEYYGDWLKIAAEESYHFQLLRERLQELDHDYGDFPAHNGLWEMAQETAYDVLARMALVPRMLEARGLDATPAIVQRLEMIKDARTISILDIILRDEIGHVAAGTRWFQFVCQTRALEPLAAFMDLLQRHMRGVIKGPFHREARLLAGFTEQELCLLEQLQNPVPDA